MSLVGLYNFEIISLEEKCNHSLSVDQLNSLFLLGLLEILQIGIVLSHSSERRGRTSSSEQLELDET